MSVADLHDLELVWPSLGPRDVIVTGTFDQWSASIHLVKGDTGFFGTVQVPWGQKVAYKFIVDGLWRCRDDQPQEDDGHGNMNNVLRTPKKSPLAYDPPARLTIPLENEGYGDIETMVTAVEFLPPPEPTMIKGSLPFPIPHIAVEGIVQAPSAATPVSVSKLDTAAATEGHISPSETPAKPDPSMEAPSSDVSTSPTNGIDNPLINGGREVLRGPHSISTYGPTQGELPPSPSVPEAANATSESVIHRPSQATQDAPALTDRINVPLVATPVAASEPTTKQTQVESHTQQAMSMPSTPASSTLTHKKWRSLFARIKRIFDKDKDKQGKKEKNKQ